MCQCVKSWIMNYWTMYLKRVTKCDKCVKVKNWLINLPFSISFIGATTKYAVCFFVEREREREREIVYCLHISRDGPTASHHIVNSIHKISKRNSMGFIKRAGIFISFAAHWGLPCTEYLGKYALSFLPINSETT
jgi:hypothetical protein